MSLSTIKVQRSSINFTGTDPKPQRPLIASAILAIFVDMRAQVDVAAGGGVDGTLVPEGSDNLLPFFRIFDGARTPIIEISAAEMRQKAQREVRGQSVPGVQLVSPSIQVATQIRRHYALYFAKPRRANPIEVHLRSKDPQNFYLEVQYPGTGLVTDLATALITGGNRTVTVSNYTLDISVLYDPAAFVRMLPIFQPRIRRYSIQAPLTQKDLEFKLKSTATAISSSLIKTADAGVVVENALNAITLRDDATVYRDAVFVRGWHEEELAQYPALENQAGVAMAYFGDEFADNGRLGTLLAPGQGGNVRWIFDVNGGATRAITIINEEYERPTGLTADEAHLPAGLL